MLRFAAILILFLSTHFLCAQDPARVYVLHDTVGESIDQSEKIKYHLFTFWSDTAFDHAEFIMQSDSSIVLIGIMKNGSVDQRVCTKENMRHYNFLVRYYGGMIPEQDNSSSVGALLGGAIVSISTAIVTYVETHRGRR
jgi:hypothetical protein